MANLAKYISGQPVIGIHPAPERYDGVLVKAAYRLNWVGALQRVVHGDVLLERAGVWWKASWTTAGERLVAL